MAECTFCHGVKDYRTSVFLAVNWDKLENIMESASTDLTSIEQESVCQNCDQLICIHNKFKSSILTNEKILKKDAETSKSNILEELLVSVGQLNKSQCNENATYCRTCYQLTTQKNRIKLDSYQNILGTMVLTCLPGLNIFLTENCYICSVCHNNLVACYQFVNMCQEAIEMKKSIEDTVDKDDELSNEPFEQEDNMSTVDEPEDGKSESEESLLVPTKCVEVDNQGRKQRGRPKTKKDPPPIKPQTNNGKPKRGRPKKTDGIVPKRQPERKARQAKRIRLEDEEPPVLQPQIAVNSKKELHQCQMCPFTCPAKKSVIWAHLREHRTSLPSGVQCWKCGAVMNSMVAIISHFAVHDMGLYLTVEEDEEDDDSDEVLAKKMHRNYKQPKKIINTNVTEFIKAIQCELCLELCENYVDFRRHNKIHIVEDMCPICPFSCSIITAMQTHLNVHHTLHKVIMNTKVYNELISDPTQPKSEKRDVKEEEEDVAPEEVTCQDCHQTFTSIPDYAGHDCPKKDQYCCGDCSLTFNTIDQLDTHKCIRTKRENKQPPDDPKSVHNNPEEPIKTTIKIEKPIGEPDFECCEKCLGGFLHSNDLINHVCDKSIEIKSTEPEPTFNLPIITAIKSEYELETPVQPKNPDPVEENEVSSSTTADVRVLLDDHGSPTDSNIEGRNELLSNENPIGDNYPQSSEINLQPQINVVSSTERTETYRTRQSVQRKLYVNEEFTNVQQNLPEQNTFEVSSTIREVGSDEESNATEYIPDTPSTELDSEESDHKNGLDLVEDLDATEEESNEDEQSDALARPSVACASGVGDSLKDFGVLKENGEVRKGQKKTDFCFFCETQVLNFARHIGRNHSSEIEVQRITSKPSGSKERKELLSRLRNKGNFINSSIACKPVKSWRSGKDLLPCDNCLGFFSSKLLWRHRKKCANAKSINHQATGQNLLLTDLKIDIQLRNAVFPRMRADQISLVAKKDPLICAFGSRYMKMHRKKHFINVTSRKMRDLARLLVEVKKIEPKINCLFDALKPTFFDALVAATKAVARYDVEKDKYVSPTYAMNMGTSLKQCAEIALNRKKVSETVAFSEAEADLKTLIQVIESQWQYEVSSQALNDLNVNRWNKVTLASDLKMFKDYLVSKADKAAIDLENDGVLKHYLILLEEIFCRVILLNRRRPGELQRLKLDTYQTFIGIDNSSSSYEEFSEVVSPTEKILLNRFKQLLILMEKAAKFKGKSLNEIDLNLEGDLMVSDENDKSVSPVPEILEHTKCELPDEKTRETCNKKKRVMVKWTEEQKKIATTFFKSHLINKKPPRRHEVDEMKRLNPNVFNNKEWIKIKVFIQNMYSKK